MYLNRFVFPAPHSSYTADRLDDKLVWIQRPKNQPKSSKSPKSIPQKENNVDMIKSLNPSTLKRNFEELEGYQKSTGPLAELDLSKVICNEEQNKIKEVTPSTRITVQNIDLEKDSSPPIWDAFSPKSSIQGVSIKIEDTEKETKHKKKNKGGGGCFGFLMKPKHNSSRKEVIPRSNRSSTSTMSRSVHTERNSLSTYKDINKKNSCIGPMANSSNFVKIPCLYIKCKAETQRTLLFFHGNGEDIYQTYELLNYLSEYLLVNVIAMEYPGYGIYKGSSSEKKILLDAEAVYNYLTSNLNIKEEDIIVAGRSIGSGPATWIAAHKNPGLLVLISAFTSLKAVVKHAFGNTARKLIKERFNNLELMSSVKCPLFILHGKNDTLIPHEQAEDLYRTAQGLKKIFIADDMDHAAFDFFNDLVVPLKKYITELQSTSSPVKHSKILPSEIFVDHPLSELKAAHQNKSF